MLYLAPYCPLNCALKLSVAKKVAVPDSNIQALMILPRLLQGKYINDAQVLREIAREAQLEDPDRVADDPTCCAKEVGAMPAFQKISAPQVSAHKPNYR